MILLMSGDGPFRPEIGNGGVGIAGDEVLLDTSCRIDHRTMDAADVAAIDVDADRAPIVIGVGNGVDVADPG